MKRTYIQPQIILVQVELDNVICNQSLTGNGEKVNIYLNNSNYPTNTASAFDAPRTRLWGNDED